MERVTRRREVSSRLLGTVYQVRCDRPGEPLEYGRNIFLFDGPTAEADARIRSAELRTAGVPGVKIAAQQHLRVKRDGERQARDVFRWQDVD